MSAQDPFYIVKEEIQGSIETLQSTLHKWKQMPSNTGEYVHLHRELLASCESIEWQVDELNKAIAVASKDPSHYHIDEVELDSRRKWTSTASNQVSSVRKDIDGGKEQNGWVGSTGNGAMQEFSSYRNQKGGKSNNYIEENNDDFISSESDRQLLLMRRQDDELDELSASVERIGDVGLTIHEELSGQDKILGELSLDMETTSNRLSFVQKKVDLVMKKVGAKGQILLMLFLVVLFIILFVLVFFT